VEKEFWGKRVENKLHAGEKQIDASIRALMELVTEVQDAQVEMKVSPVSTNATLTKVMECLMHLQEARTDITSAHRRVEQLGKDLGIRTTGVGYIKTNGSAAESVEVEPLRAQG
jgi:hypothetical protein